MPDELVVCSKAKDCPISPKECPHKEPHKRYWGLAHVGGKGDVEVDWCSGKRLCGFRFPKERIEVECIAVEHTEVEHQPVEVKQYDLIPA